MTEFVRAAAAKDHPDAIWFLATREFDEMDPEFERELLRAGRLGSGCVLSSLLNARWA